MLTIPELNFGSIDAINYTNRSQKEFLAKVFYRDYFLEDVLKEHVYFLIGEKGTGKTAYSTLLNNIDYRNTKASLRLLGETDYLKFISLRQAKHIMVSDYSDVWKVIILLLVAYHLTETESNVMQFVRFRNLRNAINEYYSNAFAPEITYALEFVEHSEVSASIVNKHLNAGLKGSENLKGVTQGFQSNLHFIRRQFEEVIKSLKLTRNHIIFIDGIDIRPEHVPYETYIECLKGLARAAWELNNGFFANIKDSRGRIKVMLLLRPDIFQHLGYQNANAKARDNAIVLDWRTDYDTYRTSRIFRLIDGILGKQQPSQDIGEGTAWDTYFPYRTPNMRVAEKEDNPFIGFLRYSFHRPRDVI
jgi:hypothetical protein